MNRRSVIALFAGSALSPLAARSAAAQDARPTVSVREAHERAGKREAVLVDIRTPEEWRDTGVPDGAIRLDMTSPAFEARLAALRAENPGKPIILICRTANRSRRVQEALLARGWRDIIDTRGGLLGDGRNKGWLDEGLPVR
jgi:rhodanese-related sulfurtransferase